jgi:hypothetical protein
MKIIKGCLITLSIFCVVFVLLFWFYKNNTIERFDSLSSEVSIQWEKTAKLIAKKNDQLKLESKISDSLKFYIQEFEMKKNLKFCDSNFIDIEYNINRLALKDSANQNYINELNQNLIKYNSLVRNYNTQKATFPNFILLRKSGLKSHFLYFENEYGTENESPKQKRRKTREWQKRIEDSIFNKQ